MFHPLEVVGRGSETQLQVGENCIQRFNGQPSPLSKCYSNISGSDKIPN